MIETLQRGNRCEYELHFQKQKLCNEIVIKIMNCSFNKKKSREVEVVRLVGFGFNGPLRQYFSLYRAVSQREGERGKRG